MKPCSTFVTLCLFTSAIADSVPEAGLNTRAAQDINECLGPEGLADFQDCFDLVASVADSSTLSHESGQGISLGECQMIYLDSGLGPTLDKDTFGNAGLEILDSCKVCHSEGFGDFDMPPLNLSVC
ncbi:hypothetical protein AYO20_01402 [Fonsecaea nubica]|uniref:Cyanovirin-N domain-containing protein n=1 Tax=Fonsecaea nubica TaxID=856822 RepID=A0A178DD00_9EURO|nr:hypothetical protein AYO20_01402 [Fonsecaea nubica]OAL39532.1 hypothetical protein AYO20_01402 [Fonsecaea nubica]